MPGLARLCLARMEFSIGRETRLDRRHCEQTTDFMVLNCDMQVRRRDADVGVPRRIANLSQRQSTGEGMSSRAVNLRGEQTHRRSFWSQCKLREIKSSS